MSEVALPLLGHACLGAALAWRDGERISVARFLGDAHRLAALLPAGGHVLNIAPPLGAARFATPPGSAP